MCLSSAFSPAESTGMYAVHQVKCMHNNWQDKGLTFHSEEKRTKNKIKFYASFISKANLKSFMKCDVLAILLQEEMPNLSLS